MGIKQIKPALDKYLNNLRAQINVSEALLYGSIVSGEATEESDVDLLIISSDFDNIDEDTRSSILYRTSVGFPFDLHVHGITPKEYENASPLTTLGEVKNSKVHKLI